VWLARVRQLAAEDALRTVEDAEFEDHPQQALVARRQRALATADPGAAATVVRESSPWTPLAIGIGIIAVIGLAGVIVYLLVRNKDGKTTVLGEIDPRLLPQPVVAPAPQVYLINTGNGQAQVVRAEPVTPPSPAFDDSNMLSMLGRIESGIGALVNHNKVPYNQSTMRTYRLPWLADASNPAVRIATAGNVSMEAVVRVVAPPGALAAFSFSPNELNITQAVVAPGLSSVPAGDTLVVPAGQQQPIHMNPRQVLYAKGNMSPTNPTGAVVVSISTVDNYISR
jgi:hypothetical protein